MFQFTHPRGVRPNIKNRRLRLGRFQFTHPRGVRLFRRFLLHKLSHGFNSRTREGCDRVLAARLRGATKVSIHAPARGATAFADAKNRWGLVSIHAPARGATLSTAARAAGIESVSIHAPARGATRLTSLSRQVSCFNSRTREGCDSTLFLPCRFGQGFNSRTREGCDLNLSKRRRGRVVSIHAPARGATGKIYDIRTISTGFNSRTREGCDRNL